MNLQGINSWTNIVFVRQAYDLGPSLMDEMDAVLRCLGGPPPPPPAPPSRPPASPPPPPSPLDDTINKRNELKEMQNTLSKAKKKQATVSVSQYLNERYH